MRTSHLFALAVAATVLGVAVARCPNQCSGHGDCGADDACECYFNWKGNDCSQRVCAFDASWADVPVATNDAHNYAECSSKGVCDRETGECVCFEGFEGRACERMSCPSSCSGHGTCETLAALAADATLSVGGAVGRTYAQWDASKIRACKCDGGYTGVDCSQRQCPRGDDPLTTGQERQVQRVTIAGANVTGEYVLVYVDNYGTEWTTRPLRAARYFQAIERPAEPLDDVEVPSAENVLDFQAHVAVLDVLQAGHFVTLLRDNNDTLYEAVDVFVEAVDGTDVTVAGAELEDDNYAVLRIFSAASPAATIERELQQLPNRAVESVTVSYGMDGWGNATGHVAVSYLVTFTSPINNVHLLHVDACACDAAGCQPFRRGLTYVDADLAVAVGGSEPDALVSTGVTGAQWSTAFDGQCNTIYDSVPAGLYHIRAVAVDNATVAVSTRAGAGAWSAAVALDLTTSPTVELGDGVTFEITHADNEIEFEAVVAAPFGVFVEDVTEAVTTRSVAEVAECSNRGNCDYETGLCNCFSGYSSDDCSVQTTLV